MRLSNAKNMDKMLETSPGRRAAVGLSGGVDSAMAAAFLLKKGFEVFGATMLVDDRSQEKIVDKARQVARYLGIEHHVFDFREAFARRVIDNFVTAYWQGETPNPCIQCNCELKFGLFLHMARAIGADCMATGHYVRRAEQPETGRFYLRRGRDLSKDQSYVLYGLNQEQLRSALFPLGDYTKEEVRDEARKCGVWDVVDREESQDICFADQDYASFLIRTTGRAPLPGNFVDKTGAVLGRHRGLIYYTLGQRKGLGIALGKPLFVLSLDPERNEVVLGDHEDTLTRELWADRLNWTYLAESGPEEGFPAQAKIRYQAPPAPARIYPVSNHKVRVVFDRPQRAVTPGQAVVFYNGDIQLGGGRIVSDWRGIRSDLCPNADRRPGNRNAQHF